MIKNPVAAVVVTALSYAILTAKVYASPDFRDSEQFAAARVSLREARGQATRRNWDELSREVQSYWTLRIVLPDGTSLEGTSARLMPDSLTMRAEKTTDKELHPKGAILIPREQVNELEIRTNQPIGRAVDRRFRRIRLLPEYSSFDQRSERLSSVVVSRQLILKMFPAKRSLQRALSLNETSPARFAAKACLRWTA